MILHSLPEKNPSSHFNQRATYYILAAAQFKCTAPGSSSAASWTMVNIAKVGSLLLFL